LNSEDLTKFSKFLHFRLPRNSDKMDLIKMGKCVFNFNFLDSIDQDEIRGILIKFIFKAVGAFSKTRLKQSVM